MAKQDSDEQFAPAEAERRLKAILKGAFSKKPTPLKAVPTRHGKPRKSGRPKR